jgi:hypothetical protein
MPHCRLVLSPSVLFFTVCLLLSRFFACALPRWKSALLSGEQSNARAKVEKSRVSLRKEKSNKFNGLTVEGDMAKFVSPASKGRNDKLRLWLLIL